MQMRLAIEDGNGDGRMDTTDGYSALVLRLVPGNSMSLQGKLE